MAKGMNRRHFVATAAWAGTALLAGAARGASGGGDEEILAHVDPELRAIARRILPMSRPEAAIGPATLAKARTASEGYARKPRATVPWTTRTVPGSPGQPPVELVIVNAGNTGKAATAGRRPAILHTHGGGFVTGSARQSVAGLQDLCEALDCVAVSVEYRLAPETTWRGSLEDNYAGLRWLHANAAELGVDPARIALFGESAGGGHAALLAIAARDRGEVPVAFQCLVYPMLDSRTGGSRAVAPHVGRIVWTAPSNRFGWTSFLGGKAALDRPPAGSVPARVTDLSGLPPAWIGVGSIDLFVDEDVDYAQRLNAAGGEAELLVVPGGFHGFDALPVRTRIADRFNAAKLDALRRGLGIT